MCVQFRLTLLDLPLAGFTRPSVAQLHARVHGTVEQSSTDSVTAENRRLTTAHRLTSGGSTTKRRSKPPTKERMQKNDEDVTEKYLVFPQMQDLVTKAGH